MKVVKNRFEVAILRLLLFILVGFIILLFTRCTSSNDFEKGKQQLEQQGYTNIINTGYSLFCCSSQSDEFSTGFIAKDKNGNVVKGCFCSGFLKGVTIRFQ